MKWNPIKIGAWKDYDSDSLAASREEYLDTKLNGEELRDDTIEDINVEEAKKKTTT